MAIYRDFILGYSNIRVNRGGIETLDMDAVYFRRTSKAERMKDITEKFYAAINEEIEKYPLRPHEGSLFISGLTRAAEIMFIVDARETHREKMTGTFDGVIGVHERTIDDDIKEIKKYFTNDWLWLPISREWLNLKNVRKITKREGMRGKDNPYFSVVVIYIDGNYEEYYCRDAEAIVKLISDEQ